MLPLFPVLDVTCRKMSAYLMFLPVEKSLEAADCIKRFAANINNMLEDLK